MLKRIRVDQLRIGMFFHELCASWLEHSLWRSQFVVRTPQQLAQLKATGVQECWIDTDKGLDLPAAPEPRTETAPAPPTEDVAPTVPMSLEEMGLIGASSDAHLPEQSTLEAESERAARVCSQARETVEGLMGAARLGRALDTRACVAVVDEISASLRRNKGALLGLVRLKTHDDYTFMHSVAVSTLMVALATKMGRDPLQVREAGIAGMLHDIGKARIPLAVLNKPGRLVAEEVAIVRSHPRLGHDLLRDEGIHSLDTLDVCLHHHERPDGKGYPDRQRGEGLSLLARMGAICDVYDAITSNRPYKDEWGPAESISLMSRWTKEGQFDPLVFRTFVDCVGIYPIGSLVRLQSGRLAVVIEQNDVALTAPRVRAFFSVPSGTLVPIEAIDLAAPGCADRIVARESPRKWEFGFLDRLATAAFVAPGQTCEAWVAQTPGSADC